MKLTEFRVREFRSIWDSGPVKVDDVNTCLVGNNEAGKTALLTALYLTNPIIAEHAQFDLTYDYPKREVEDYRFAIENEERDEVVVVECKYELDEADLNAVSVVFGPKALTGKTIFRYTYYGENEHKFVMSTNDAAARQYLATNAALADELVSQLKAAADWQAFAAALDAAEATEAVTALKALVAKVLKSDLARYIFGSIIWSRAPKFLYFDEYYQLKGQDNLNALITRLENNQLEDSDRPLIGLINLARLNLKELVQTQNTTELKNKLQNAGNFLTQRIVKYWSQNQHVQLRFDVRDAKPQDPPGMQSGINVWGEVYDSAHMASTPLGVYPLRIRD